ncbi:MAG: iron-siderophore ABC transporter substrate-binding protein [Pseudomonadota bacterium]
MRPTVSTGRSGVEQRRLGRACTDSDAQPLSRRSFLTATAGAGAALCSFASAAADDKEHGPLRIVTLDAALTQTTLALGVSPVGVSGASFYRSFVIEPPLPSGVVDVGTRSEPNVELLLEIAPDVILYSPEYGQLTRSLADRIPTTPIAIYVPGSESYFEGATLATEAVAERLGRSAQAHRCIADANERVVSMRRILVAAKTRSVCVMSFLSSRIVRLYTRDSLFGGVLQAAGIRNVVAYEGNKWGFTDVGMAALAEYDADLYVHIGAIPARATVSPVWNALPFVRQKRIVALPTIWMFGGLPSATRFADGLAAAIGATDGTP